jgi:nitric oxide dioxygenase
MTPEQYKLIRWSFAEIYFSREESAKIFYDRLFAIAPEMRQLFKSDMEVQGKKLMDTLALAVATLDNAERLALFLEETAVRHNSYGATPERYKLVGEALLWMMEKQLKNEFTPDLRTAWIELYRHISHSMQEMATAATKN